ncbi:hypothetical protein GGR56DRAFT_601214 [Xylariaceae sp. FL0804]|nr:hypothetical protein GGR56DRAFT_601214 [Xylariaceae sp. FL0804]
MPQLFHGRVPAGACLKLSWLLLTRWSSLCFGIFQSAASVARQGQKRPSRPRPRDETPNFARFNTASRLSVWHLPTGSTGTCRSRFETIARGSSASSPVICSKAAASHCRINAMLNVATATA